MDLRVVGHVAIATHDLATVVELFEGVLGGPFVMAGDDLVKDIRTIQIGLGNGKVELMAPLIEDSYLHRFLECHGPRFHHMTVFVPDVRTAVREAEATGFETVDLDVSHRAWGEVYIRPRSGFGTLIQLVQTDRQWDVGRPGMTAADVLAGRVVWWEHGVWWREEVAVPVAVTGDE